MASGEYKLAIVPTTWDLIPGYTDQADLWYKITKFCSQFNDINKSRA